MFRTWKISPMSIVMVFIALRTTITTSFLIIRPTPKSNTRTISISNPGFYHPLGCGYRPATQKRSRWRRIVNSELHYKPDGEIICNDADNNNDTDMNELLSAEEEEEEIPLLTGLVVNSKYILTEHIPVASQKCELYEAYQQCDYHTRQYPFVVKLSSSLEQIDLEYENYRYVSNGLSSESQQNLFVKIYDKIEEADYDRGAKSNGRRRMSGILMERGKENLRFHIQQNGAFRGTQLRNSIQTVISIVGALHEIGMVWTEIKAENFVIATADSSSSKADPTIKGIDLESLVVYDQLMRMYTAEACPPEFPIQEMYKSLPSIRMDYSFDMWGLGMTLFEMATGRPYYQDGLTDLEYIKGMLCDPNKLIAHRDSRLVSVDPQVRNIIQLCLQIDPTDRSSCQELLQDPYFTNTTTTEAAAHSSTTPSCINNSREEQEQRNDKFVSSHFGDPESQEGNDGKQPPQESTIRISRTLEGHGLSIDLISVLSDALDVCAKYDPYIVENFMFQLQIPVSSSSSVGEERGIKVNKNNNHRGGIPKNAYKGLLDIIHICNAHDQKAAIRLLSMLENEITQKSNRQDDDGILAP